MASLHWNHATFKRLCSKPGTCTGDAISDSFPLCNGHLAVKKLQFWQHDLLWSSMPNVVRRDTAMLYFGKNVFYIVLYMFNQVL